MLVNLLLVAGVALLVYAMVTQWNNTDKSESVPKRVWAAIVAAVASLGVVVANWLDLVNVNW